MALVRNLLLQQQENTAAIKKKEPSSLSFVNLERQTKQGQGFGSGSVLAAAHSFPAVLQLSFAGSFEVWMEKQRLTSHF